MSVIAQHLIAVFSALPTDASALESSISALKSSLSALETAIKALDDSSSFWEGLLPWFSAMVVVGVAAEIWAIFWDHGDDLAAWRRGIVRPPDRPSVGKLCLEVIATFLVVFGVFGELAIGIEIARINGQLRTKNAELREKSDQLIALVTQETKQLGIDLETEKQESAAAKLALARAFDAEKERHEPRHVTPAQAACIKDALKGLSGQRVKMGVYQVPEAHKYGFEIATAFIPITNGEIDVQEENGLPDRTGILVENGSKQLSDAAYKALNCLVPSGAPKIDGKESYNPDQELTIFVFPDTSRRSPPR